MQKINTWLCCRLFSEKSEPDEATACANPFDLSTITRLLTRINLEPIVYLEDFVPKAFDVDNAYVTDIDKDANPEEKDGKTDGNLYKRDYETDTDPEEKEGVTETISSESELETDGFMTVVQQSSRAQKKKGVYEPEMERQSHGVLEQSIIIMTC